MRAKEPAREGFLYHLWLNREFKNIHLQTICGHKIEILEKGQRNYNAGPDFLNALLRIDSTLKRGDIEIHPVAGDWYAHGHQEDPRYNNVILHLVTMNCPKDFITRKKNGAFVHTMNLDDYLEKTAEELELECDYAKSGVIESCKLSTADTVIIKKVLEQGGDNRLSIKMARFRERSCIDSWDQLLYRAIMEALGYAKNQIPFQQLASKLPARIIWNYVWNDTHEMALKKIEAYLFGAAGFIPLSTREKSQLFESAAIEYINELETFWNLFPKRTKIDVLSSQQWQFFRLRPKNFPLRRIAAAAVLLHRFMNEGFVEKINKVIYDLWSEPEKLPKELEKLFIVQCKGFWKNHFTFHDDKYDRRNSRADRFIIGEQRARDIVINVVLPCLLIFAEKSSDLKLQNVLKDAYTKYPICSDNEITRSMRTRIFGFEKGGKAIITGARLQQGLIYLFREMCTPGTCIQCMDKLR